MKLLRSWFVTFTVLLSTNKSAYKSGCFLYASFAENNHSPVDSRQRTMIRRVIYDVEFRVLVKEKLSPSDSVLVTGSCEQLGEWLPKRCVPLTRSDKTDDGEIWSTNIKIYGPQKVFYRYLIAQVVRTDEDRNLIVKKCKSSTRDDPSSTILSFRLYLGETFKQARQLVLNHRTDDFEGDSSAINDGSDPSDEFPAVFGCYQGISRTDIGWLTGQSEIQLRFHSNPLQIWPSKLKNSKISLKVSPIGRF